MTRKEEEKSFSVNFLRFGLESRHLKMSDDEDNIAWINVFTRKLDFW